MLRDGSARSVLVRGRCASIGQIYTRRPSWAHRVERSFRIQDQGKGKLIVDEALKQVSEIKDGRPLILHRPGHRFASCPGGLLKVRHRVRDL